MNDRTEVISQGILIVLVLGFFAWFGIGLYRQGETSNRLTEELAAANCTSSFTFGIDSDIGVGPGGPVDEVHLLVRLSWFSAEPSLNGFPYFNKLGRITFVPLRELGNKMLYTDYLDGGLVTVYRGCTDSQMERLAKAFGDRSLGPIQSSAYRQWQNESLKLKIQ